MHPEFCYPHRLCPERSAASLQRLPRSSPSPWGKVDSRIIFHVEPGYAVCNGPGRKIALENHEHHVCLPAEAVLLTEVLNGFLASRSFSIQAASSGLLTSANESPQVMTDRQPCLPVLNPDLERALSKTSFKRSSAAKISGFSIVSGIATHLLFPFPKQLLAGGAWPSHTRHLCRSCSFAPPAPWLARSYSALHPGRTPERATALSSWHESAAADALAS